jgi:cation transporter-like permease
MDAGADRDMTRNTLGGAVMALALVAAVGFLGVAIHEFSYASDHPYAYGPAKVIAWGGCAGAVLCIAVVLVGYALTRPTGR